MALISDRWNGSVTIHSLASTNQSRPRGADEPCLLCNRMSFTAVTSVKKLAAIPSQPLITSAALTPTPTRFNERAYWRKMPERHPLYLNSQSMPPHTSSP